MVSWPQDWSARINGVILKARNTNDVGFASGFLGSGGGTNNAFAGHIAEVLIYKRRLTPTERFDVETYLNWRYSLVASPPATPTNLTAFAVSISQVALAWSSALSNVNIKFTVQRKASGGSFTSVAVLDNATSYLDTGLSSGTEYFYRVMAANYAGVSGCSETNVTTLTNGTAIPMDALKTWLKADSGHGGSPINCWADQTTNGNHAFIVFGDCGGQYWPPNMVDNWTNGRPAIYFNNYTNALRFSSWFAYGWQTGEVFAVLRSLGGNPPQREDICTLWSMGP